MKLLFVLRHVTLTTWQSMPKVRVSQMGLHSKDWAGLSFLIHTKSLLRPTCARERRSQCLSRPGVCTTGKKYSDSHQGAKNCTTGSCVGLAFLYGYPLSITIPSQYHHTQARPPDIARCERPIGAKKSLDLSFWLYRGHAAKRFICEAHTTT